MGKHEPRHRMPSRMRVAMFALVAAVGCIGSLAASAASAQGMQPTPPAERRPGDQPEQLVRVVLATLPVIDTAPAVVADKYGFFREEGLALELRLVQTGPATTGAVASGAAHFSQSNYATLFSARSNGVPVMIVAEAARARPGFSAVVVLPDSPIRQPRDLQGKRIATSVIGGIGPLAINVWLKDAGIDYTTIQWVQMPFQDMGPALEKKQVDAAWVVEPFVTLMKERLNVRVVFDVFSGPTEGLPVAAFATSDRYAKEHPDIVARFARAISKASALITRDPSVVRSVIPQYTSIPAELAGKIALEAYPEQTDLAQITRVADFMRQVGFLQKELNVEAMVWSPVR